MTNAFSEILKHFHTFGLLNIFLLYVLLLAYSSKKQMLWYGAFVLTIALDLFNYVGLYELYNYSENFTLPYLPWASVTPIILYKYVLNNFNIKSISHKKTFRFLIIASFILLCYFIIKSYYVLLGDLSIRNHFFDTQNTLPRIEYWVTNTITLAFHAIGLTLTYTLIKNRNRGISREIYFMSSVLLIAFILLFVKYISEIYYGPKNIISFPSSVYLTILTAGGMIIGYKKLIGIDYSKTTAKQKPSRTYEQDNTQLKHIEQKIVLAMETQELYKNQKLQLKDLSKAVKTSEHSISEVLAKQLQTNYYDFINSYRVKEVIRLMKSESHKDYKLMALANEAGFNSKTTFNTTFKKITGYTPSAYRKLEKL